MGISANQAVLSLLKTYYRDEVQNLLFRNSPVLMKLKKERVEGKEQAFSAIYGRGGAVSADFNKAKAQAAIASKAVEFKVTPGSLFSCYTMTSGEVQASQTKRGAYMKVAGAKMFAASEGFRQTLAAALYGSGFGELCVSGYTTQIVANTPFNITLTESACLKIDIGTVLDLKASYDAYNIKTHLTVNSIDGTTVNVTPDTSVSAPLATDWICLTGCVSGSAGNPIPRLPVGLAGWLPTVGGRTGGTWTTYIAKDFFGVDRSIAPDRLAGSYYKAASTEDASDSVKAAIKLARRHGSRADIIIMNDDDFAKFSEEIEATNTFFTATSTLERKQAAVGITRASAAFSTNYIENIWDDPYCPKGTFYVLDSAVVELWSYTNTDKADNGVASNDPGKQDPMNMNDEGKAETPYGLIIDDYLNVSPGADTADGPSSCVSILFYGSFVVMNPSVCAVGEFNYV